MKFRISQKSSNTTATTNNNNNNNSNTTSSSSPTNVITISDSSDDDEGECLLMSARRHCHKGQRHQNHEATPGHSQSSNNNPDMIPKKPTNTFSSATTCPICLDSLHSTGSHQISCLPCGHLFGKDCILKWLHQGKKKCPICAMRCFITQIRCLFVNNLHQMGGAPQDGAGNGASSKEDATSHTSSAISSAAIKQQQQFSAAQKKWKKQKEAFEATIKELKLRNQMLTDRVTELEGRDPEGMMMMQGAESTQLSSHSSASTEDQSESSSTNSARKRKRTAVSSLEHDSTVAGHSPQPSTKRRSVTPTGNAISATTTTTSSPLIRSKVHKHKSPPSNVPTVHYKPINQVKVKSARAMVLKSKAVYITTKCSRKAAYGVRLISLSNLSSSSEIAVHDKVIRDVVVDPLSDLLLTGSDDYFMRITDMRDRKPVFHFNTKKIVHSCAWSKKHPNFLFGGLENGSLLVLDNRKNDKEPLYTLSLNDRQQPVHSLYYHQNFCSTGVGGLLSACSSGVSLIKEQDSYENLPLMTGVASCVTYDTVSRRILATFRSTEYTPSCHRVFGLSGRGTSVTPTKWDQIEGFTSRQFEPSNLIFCLEQPVQDNSHDDDGYGGALNTFVASPDEAEPNVIRIWHSNSCTEVGVLKCQSSPIFSVRSFLRKRHLLALSRDHFMVFKNSS